MGLGVIKEFRCIEHGEFEASHPICPAHGCDSRAVWREFRTAPNIGTDAVRRHSASSKKTSEMYRINNFRTARAGETAFGGELGKGLLWGNDCQKVLGKSFAELSQIAQRPLAVRSDDGRDLTLRRNNAMADAAEAAGVTSRRIAKPGELTGVKRDHTPTGVQVTEATARQQMGID